MNDEHKPATLPRPGRAEPQLPRLEAILDGAAGRLSTSTEIGLISVSVLQRAPQDPGTSWRAYDALHAAIGAFLREHHEHRMRRNDRLFEPSLRGNSFALLLEPPRHGRALEAADVMRVAARLRRGLRMHLAKHVSGELTDAFGSYVGAALVPIGPGIPFERVVHRALEEAFADALREKEREGRRRAARLARVIELGLIRSVYQPVVDIVDRRVIGFEALTRVVNGRFDNIETLFKAADNDDALWSLDRLCRQRALEGVPKLAPDQLLFLNIEPDSAYDPDLTGAPFLDRLAVAGLSPGQIVLELTEHTAVRDFGALRRTLERFRDLGFRVAMDDVGSGYAGLQAIAELAPDFIKADMHIVRGLHESAIKRELIDTMQRFSESTGITLVAEGVESSDELKALVSVGVRCAQGFLFARPGSPAPVPDWARLPAAE